MTNTTAPQITAEELAIIADELSITDLGNIDGTVAAINSAARRIAAGGHRITTVVTCSARGSLNAAWDRLAEAELSTTAHRNRRIAQAQADVNTAELTLAGIAHLINTHGI